MQSASVLDALARQSGSNGDGDFRVTRFCVDAALVAQSIAQPRSATLHVETPIRAKEMEEVKGSLMGVHFAARTREAADGLGWYAGRRDDSGSSEPPLFGGAEAGKVVKLVSETVHLGRNKPNIVFSPLRSKEDCFVASAEKF